MEFEKLISDFAERHTVRLKGASGESKGLRRYDKENLLWQFTVAIRSDRVGSVGSCWLQPTARRRPTSVRRSEKLNAPCGWKRKYGIIIKFYGGGVGLTVGAEVPSRGRAGHARAHGSGDRKRSIPVE